MKKMATFLAVVLTCLTLAVPALADTGATLVRGSIPDARWVYGTSLLRVSGSDGYGLQTIDGTAVTESIYSNLDSSKGYITAAYTGGDGLNVFGVLDATGRTVLPFQYGDVRVESSEWALGVTLTGASAENYDYKNYSGDAFYLIQSVDVYHLPEGALLATLTRDQFLDADAVNHCLNIQDRATNVISCYDASFNQVGTNLGSLYDDDYAPADYQYYRENGQTGIKDAAGNIIMAPAFQSVYNYKDGYFLVSTGSAEGLVDLSGNVVVPAEYEKIKSCSYMPMDENGENTAYVAYGYVCVVKDGKMGYVDINGNVTCAPTYAEKSFDSNYGVSAKLLDMEGKTHIISADGMDTTLEGYEHINPLDYTAGMYYKVYDGSKYGVIDWHGKQVLPCQYDSIYSSSDGQYVLALVDYDYYEIYQLSYAAQDAATAASTDASGDVSGDAGEEVPQTLLEGVASMLNPDSAEPAADESASIAEGEPAGEEAPAPEAAPAGSSAEVKPILDSVIALLNADAAANQAAALGLLNNAVALLGDGNADAVNLINGAITLLNTDAAANASSVVTILNSVSSMLN